MEELASEADSLRAKNEELSNALNAITPHAMHGSPVHCGAVHAIGVELEAALAAREDDLKGAEEQVQKVTAERDQLQEQLNALMESTIEQDGDASREASKEPDTELSQRMEAGPLTLTRGLTLSLTLSQTLLPEGTER